MQIQKESTSSQSNGDLGTCNETDFGTSGKLSSRLWRIADRDCIPLGATLEITLKCNLRCTHCYNFDRSEPYPKELKGNELNPSEIFSIIEQLSKAGCLYLSLTGGEALVHPHIYDFIEHARRQRLLVKVKSNGTLLTEERVQRLVEAGAQGVDVSLYGATPETHDNFTVQRGSFEKTIQGIKNAVQGGLVVKVNICLVRSNAGEIGEMVEFVEGMNLSYGISPFITARYDGTDSSMDESVEEDVLEKLYRGPLNHLLRKPNFNPKKSVQCACARCNCGITSTGEVYPCIGAPVPSGNLRKQSFAEIWEHSPEFNRIRNLRLSDFKTCKTCPDRPYCGRNSGVVYSNTGEYTGPEPFTCMEAATVRRVTTSLESTSDKKEPIYSPAN